MKILKPVLFTVLLEMILAACTPQQEISKTSARLTNDSQDSSQYDLLIVDAQFEQWYLINYNSSKDLSEDYYRYKNQIAASNWNDYYRLNKFPKVIDSYLNYQPGVNYGLELDRKLYWYFLYVKNHYRIDLFR